METGFMQEIVASDLGENLLSLSLQGCQVLQHP